MHTTDNMHISFTHRIPSKAPVFSLSKKAYHHCLVLVGSMNKFEHDLHEENCLFHKQTKGYKKGINQSSVRRRNSSLYFMHI